MNIRNISVAIVEPVGGHGGMDFYDFGLCGGLVKAGCRVSLYTCDKTKSPAIPGLLFYPIYKGIYGSSASWLRAFRFLVASLKIIVRVVFSGQKICHFHFFHGGVTEVLGLLLAKLFLRKVVITVHDVESFGESFFSPRTVGSIYGLSDCIIVHNQMCRAEIIEKLGVSPNKVRIVPMGNYLYMMGDVYGKNEAKRLLGIDVSKKLILFFGQIKEVKGLELLIKAMPAVLVGQPDTVLLIAGRPWRSDFSYYEELMDRLGVRDHCISHIRFIPDEEVSLYYGACDVVVLPYRRIYQSAVVLMAMSYGKAVLVSDLPGMTEMVSDGENGFVFRQGCDDDLALKLSTILNDDALREQVAMNGLEYVRRNHDWSFIGEVTAKLYESVMA